MPFVAGCVPKFSFCVDGLCPKNHDGRAADLFVRRVLIRCTGVVVRQILVVFLLVEVVRKRDIAVDNYENYVFLDHGWIIC